jgi:hypothetical protein
MGEEHISTITDYGVEIVSALTSCNPRQTSWTGPAFIVLVGLLNFHVPHFLLESRDLNTTEYLLEAVLLANVAASLVAAFGILCSRQGGWIIGIVVCVFSAILWVAQESIGLPGLPQQWFEPSRLVSLLIETSFVVLAWNRLQTRRGDRRERVHRNVAL